MCFCRDGKGRLLGAVCLEDSGDFSIVLCFKDISGESVRNILLVEKALCWALQEKQQC